MSYFETTAVAETIRGLFSDGGSATFAFFLIDGNDDFDNVNDYSGKFSSGSASGTLGGRTGGVYYAISPTCTAVGVRYGGSFSAKPNPLRSMVDLNVGFSVTYYSEPYVLC